jgi:hypothetical protein
MRLKEYMQANNLTNEKVGELVGVKPDTVKMWKSNAVTTIPTCKFELLRLKVMQTNVQYVWTAFENV